jgi:hypothetical protein
MKGALIGLFIGLTLLVFLYFKLAPYRSSTSFDIHVHDTYFVLDYLSATGFALIFLGTFFAIGGIIYTHFKSKLFWLLTVLFLSIDTFCAASFFKAFNNNDITFPKE